MAFICQGINYLTKLWDKIEPPMPFFLGAGFLAGLDYLNVRDKVFLEKVQSVCCKAFKNECSAFAATIEERFNQMNITVICKELLPTELMLRNGVVICFSMLTVASVLVGLGISVKILYDEYQTRQTQMRRFEYITLADA